MNAKLFALINSTTAFFIFAMPALSDDEFPSVTITEITEVFDNGQHNAFTDLTWFKGKLYLAFRSCPDGHMVHPTSQIIVLTSTTGDNWKQVHSFNVPNRDTRDPHFVHFGDKLFVYTGTWYCGEYRPPLRNMNQMLGFGVNTSDGQKWSTPFPLEGTYGHYVWRGATHQGAVFLCARRRNGFAELANLTGHDEIVQSRLLKSTNGVAFKDIGYFQDKFGDETSFFFDEKGVIHAVSRRGGNRTAELITLKPPYDTPVRKDLGRYIGGPLIFNFENHTLVAGRNVTQGKAVTNISLLRNGQLRDLVNLPSGGDCSYPGMVALCPGCVLVSWYSSHLKDDKGSSKTAVFTAKLNFN